MLTCLCFCPGPGASRRERQQQLAQYRTVAAGHRRRDCRYPDGDIPAGIRGRNAVLEWAAYETERVPTRRPNTTPHASRLDLTHTVRVPDRRRRPLLPGHQQ